MTHIANCMRKGLEKISSAYIIEETQLAMLTQKNPVIGEILCKQEKSPQRSIKHSTSRYQLWPRSKPKETVHPATFGTFLITETEKANALSAGRSPTSLSENAIGLDQQINDAWPRSSSLARRRKVSVPELKRTVTDLPESVIHDMDSPTIPGMPPLRRMVSMDAVHSRSSSAPSQSRTASADDLYTTSLFATPPRKTVSSGRPPLYSNNSSQTLPATTYNPTRPLSPIMSPRQSLIPHDALGTPSTENLKDVPPKVPPKTPFFALPPPRVAAKFSPTKLATKSSKPFLRPSPLPPVNTLTPPASASNSPSSQSECQMSPVELQGDMPLHNKNSIDSFNSIMTRGRPMRKKLLNHQDANLGEEMVMPAGLKPFEATLIMPEQDRETLRRQAMSKAEHFEVFGSAQVDLLTKDIATLDERCEYLRRTYKSLRSGRQKLHARMVNYLSSESIAFSRENLLKQEEALIELDISIDDWFEKLECAETRRTCLRQKLLEHTAAAIAMNSSYPPPPNRAAPTTPPCEPVRGSSIDSARLPRSEVQSIKVYADNGVLNLFNDIEVAVSRMCEAC